MKRTFLTLLLALVGLSLFASSEYTIVTVLEKIETNDNTYAVCKYSSNSPQEVKYILLPTKIDEGKYKVKISRVDQDIYIIEGTDLYIKTNYCYELCYNEEVILIIRNGYNRKCSFGEVIFD